MIVTFYSFKGGVGRSFSLLETAAQLAARGASVVVWDLDLEAPGLQKLPMLTAPLETKLRVGTLDLLLEFEKGGYAKFPERVLRRAVVPYELPPAVAANQGRLDFLLPGQLDTSYGKKFGRIDWARLFAPGEALGAAFFLHAAKLLQDGLGYEYVLIDARTGFTDLGAVCTLALPDLVVIVFNLNEQNLAGIERVHLAVTETRRSVSGPGPVLLLASMIPEEPADVREKKLAKLAERGLRPHVMTPLRPELLLTDALPTLASDGPAEIAEDWRPLVDEIEERRRRLTELSERAEAERLRRLKPGEDAEALERRGIYEKAKSFEERVAELFRLLGYSATVDYKKDDMQFDVRLELASGPLPTYVLVECKQTARAVTQKEVRELASKVAHARTADQKPYQAILVSQSGFANNAHAVAAQQFVQLLTFEQLLLSLVDLTPSLEAAITGFRNTALERLYVEQEVVLQSDLEPGKTPRALPLSETVREWLDRPTGSFMALLGDFGSGKTSFCRRLACELALAAREKAGRRSPVLIDLREGGSTTVTFESLLTHHFQRLSSRAFNPQALLHLNREGYLVLFFDGFDEILGYAEPNRFVEILRQILRAAEGKAKVILTCRTHYFRDLPDEVKTLAPRPGVLTSEGATRLFEELRERPGAEVGYLRELPREQIDEYLQRALPPPADWQAFRSQIERTYNLEDLAGRPFLLEMIVKTLPRLERAGEVTIADLYEAYCASWFAKTDFHLTMTREVKEALVEYLARMIWDSTEQHVHFQVLAEKAVEFFRDRPLSVLDKEKVDYEVRTALFLHRNPEGYYAFIHRSFLEFFVARTLRKGLREGNASSLALRRLTREVAFFLSFWPEAEQIPALAGMVLEAPYRPRVSENALLLLVFHTRSQVMPLVGPEAEAVDEQALLRAREIFLQMRPIEIRLEGADLEAADLRAIDLSGARLTRSRFWRTDLRQAVLEGTNLEQADLGFSDLRGARLEAAVLIKADLDHTDARTACFEGANLTGANLGFGRFSRANLHNARIEGCNLGGAGFYAATGWAHRVRPGLPALLPQFGHGAAINSVAWSPDGQFIVSGSDDASIKVWDAVSGTLLRNLEAHQNSVLSVLWVPTGQRVASCSEDKSVKIWDPQQGSVSGSLEGHTGIVRSIAWLPAIDRLASVSDDQTLKIWDPTSGTCENSFETHEFRTCAVSSNPTGELVAIGSGDQQIRVFRSRDGAEDLRFTAHSRGVRSVAWHPHEVQLASGSDDTTAKVWNAASGSQLLLMHGHERGVRSVAWSPSGDFLASASDDGLVKVWYASNGQLGSALKGHVSGVLSVDWSPTGERLVSASADHSIRIWNALDGRSVHTISGHNNRIFSLSWDSSGSRLAIASSDKTLKIWKVSEGAEILTLSGHNGSVLGASWDSRGRYIASTSLDRTLRLWEPEKSNSSVLLRPQVAASAAVAWHPMEEILAFCSDDFTVSTVAISGRQERHSMGGPQSSIRAVAWSPSGDRIAGGSSDDTVRIWSLEGKRPAHSLRGHLGPVNYLAWDPTSTYVASASDDQTVRIWNAERKHTSRCLRGHTNLVRCVAWHPTGKMIASGSLDHTVKIWNPEDGSLIATLVGSMAAILAIGWHPSRFCLAVATLSGWIDLWDVSTPEPKRVLRLYNAGLAGGFAATPDGYVDGSPAALELVRYVENYAIYDLDDLPERHSPERIQAVLHELLGEP